MVRRPRRALIVTELLVVLVLVLLNGVFSGAEIALLSVRRTRIAELVDQGRAGAWSVGWLRSHPERLLATVQVGITVVSASAAAFGGSSIAEDVSALLRPLPTVGPHADAIGFAVVVGGISFLSLVLGELVPKSLALRAAEPYALVVGPLLAALAQVARPLVWILTTSSNLVLRLFGDRTSFSEIRHSPEELQQLVDEAASAGTVPAEVGEIASRALEFDELDVSVVMLPAGDIVSIRSEATFLELAALARDRGHSRILVHDGDLDQLLGYVHVRDALARAFVEPELELADVVQPVPFLPDTLPAPRALRELQRQRVPLAVVVDEQGTIRGLVTIEDLVEELVGEILTEGDAPEQEVRRDADGSVLIPGSTPLHEVNRTLGTDLPEPESAGTIAGLVTTVAGRIPDPGSRWTVDGWDLEVVEATRRRVKTVRLRAVAARSVEEPRARASSS